ncbi:hypothetical protein Q31b_11970 [Novipirellula aureliae]|uniref:Uncharacterized protein n=1 Tax=Novipirellula aureliae TaxID=2527966 RepID=A0A5C6EFK1_9BACT|nr:hypothetical protein [Novipirellula aureliae]TWU46019.1 hypothetical protein Q31b_11970 [Novipirellula aureliae]
MAGDLEDFLRRAAQRRQAKAGGGNAPAGGRTQQPQRPQSQQPQRQTPQRQTPQRQKPQRQKPQRQKPQYSNSRTERVARPVDEEIVVAEVVEDVDSQWNQRRRKIEDAKRAAKQAEQEAAQAFSKLKSPAGTQALPASKNENSKVTGFTIEDLVQVLHRPGGMQQAVLLREILDRPEHRW